MIRLFLSPVTEQSEQATAYAADGKMNYGLMPQFRAVTDNNLTFKMLNNLNIQLWKR